MDPDARVRLTITSITSCNNLLLMSDLLLNLPFFSLVVSKMEVGPTKPTAENDLILNFKGQNILLMNLLMSDLLFKNTF